MRFLILISFAVLVTLSACERVDDLEVVRPVSVVPRASLPVARASARVFTLNGKAYVIGGRQSGDARNPNYCSDMWSYDPTSDAWQKETTPPMAPRVQAVAATIGDKAYYGLGFGGTGPYELSIYHCDFWQYDGKEWKQLSDFPAEGSDALVVFPTDTALFVCLGYNPIFQPEVYCYHVKTDKWTQCRNSDYIDPAAGCVGGSALGRYYAGGGFMEVTLQQWSEYNPATDTWQRRQAMPYPGRLFAATATSDNEILMLGGMIWGSVAMGGGATGTIYSYDVERDQWERRGTLPRKMMNNVAFCIDGRVFCGLGEDSDGNVLNNLYEIMP